MAGNKSGGLKARDTNYERQGRDFYRRIGKKGGEKAGIIKGFAANRELARKAGAKGGRISKRGKAKNRKIRVSHVRGSIASVPVSFGEL